VIPEVFSADDPALAHRNDLRHIQVSLRAMACAMPDEPHDHSVADIDEVADHFHGVDVHGGPDGQVATSDNTLFMSQGIFVPWRFCAAPSETPGAKMPLKNRPQAQESA
jgi:hypothetical protein